jgi:hypothetical protein
MRFEAKLTDPRQRNDVLRVSFGGGTNSYAMVIALSRFGIRPDALTFADTGGEKPYTYRAIEVINGWLTKVGFPTVVTVRNDGKWGTLEAQCLGTETLPSLAFGHKTCSLRYKIEVQRKYVNNNDQCRDAISSGGRIISAIGYDAGESRRTYNGPISKDESRWYPLIELGWDRDRCREEIDKAGLPRPGKSSCFYCPASKKHEVISLAINHPDLYARAVEIERRARASGRWTNVVGLGRHWSWEELVQEASFGDHCAAPPPDDDDNDDMPCGCYDG